MMPILRSCLSLALLAPAAALAAPLDLDPADPPVVGQALGGGVHLLHLPGHPPVRALPALIVTQDPGLAPPHPDAEPLGPSGRSWRIPTVDVAQAVALGLALRDRPGITSALPDLLIAHTPMMFDDPRYPSQWYLQDLQMEALYEVTLGDPSVRVAVIDSAVDVNHPDLAGALDAPFDAYADDADPSPDPGVYCQGSTTEICDHHGTSVAGIIGARANNGTDIAGICPGCTLIPIRMIGPGQGTLGRDVAAFEHAIASDAAVINNSWGFTHAMAVPGPLAEVIRRASTEPRGGLGALVIFAAGNDDREIGDDELQAMPEVLSVSATDRYGLPTAYTNRGASVDIAAPSATVTLQAGGGVTSTFGGTSAAAPVVAGLAAWALSVDPGFSSEELQDLLVGCARPSPLVTADERGHHPVYGYGEIQAVCLRGMLVTEHEEEPDDGSARGCGCSSGGGAPAWALLLGAVGILRRRRR